MNNNSLNYVGSKKKKQLCFNGFFFNTVSYINYENTITHNI